MDDPQQNLRLRLWDVTSAFLRELEHFPCINKNGLLVILHGVYQALFPELEPLPRTSEPSTYVDTIERHLGINNIDEPNFMRLIQAGQHPPPENVGTGVSQGNQGDDEHNNSSAYDEESDNDDDNNDDSNDVCLRTGIEIRSDGYNNGINPGYDNPDSVWTGHATSQFEGMDDLPSDDLLHILSLQPGPGELLNLQSGSPLFCPPDPTQVPDNLLDCDDLITPPRSHPPRLDFLDDLINWDSETGAASAQLPLEELISLPPSSPPVSPELELEPHSDIGQASDLPGLLHLVEGLGETRKFNLRWGTFDCEALVRFLRALQPGEQTPGALINYFGRKLSASGRVCVIDAEWYSQSNSELQELNFVSMIPILIPYFDSEYWSLIEVDPEGGAIVHYDSLSEGGNNHQHVESSCRHCHKVSQAIAKSLNRQCWSVPTWDIAVDCQWLNNPYDCGISLLWLLHLRDSGNQIIQMPSDYRFQLAQELVDDLRKCNQRQMLQETVETSLPGLKRKIDSLYGSPGADEVSSVVLEQQWRDFGEKSQYYGVVEELHRVAKVTNRNSPSPEPIGLARASRLIQLAISLASRDVFLRLKQLVLNLRNRATSKPPSFSEDIHGLIQAGIWHSHTEESSMVSLRLVSWYISEDVKKRTVNGTTTVNNAISDIIEQCGNSDTTIDLESTRRRVVNWNRRGREWSHLVANVSENLSVLCYIPRDGNVLTGSKPIGPTEYRDLKLHEGEELGKVLKHIRPDFKLPSRKELFEMFLWNKIPQKRFTIESWDDQYIMSLPEDSLEFLSAFELVAD